MATQYADSDYILVRITDRCWIPSLMMAGPVIHPIKVMVSDAIDMIMRGMHVYEVTAKNDYPILLTMDNVKDADKFTKKTEVTNEQLGNPVETTTTTGIPKPEEKDDDEEEEEEEEQLPPA